MNLLILLPILLPLVSAFIVYSFNNKPVKVKNITIISLISLTFVFALINCFIDFETLNLFEFSPSLKIAFDVDTLSKLFSVAISFIFILVSTYTFEYIKHEDNQNRFYTFMFSTLAMLMALCYANNILTMYLCFEMVTLLSMPLVLHSLTKQAINAAKKYLFYSLGGAFLALVGIFYIIYNGGNASFVFGGNAAYTSNVLFEIAMLCAIVGFSAKAGMFPLHGWLATAHPVAPSPASAILSGVITKAGIISVIRVVYYVIGMDALKGSFVQYVWLSLASLTILLGSLLAILEKNFKKRLAYSSVSQLSYILVALAMLNEVTFMGALIHVVAHMLIKVCLFLFAGEQIYKHGYTEVSELRGIGIKSPISTWSYTIASLGLIGIPMTAGFVSKWYIASGAVSTGIMVFDFLVPIVLLISAILTAGYLLPISINGFFVKDEKYDRCKISKLMYIPMILLATLIVVIGIYSEPLISLISSILGK